jgi:putative ABC transport system ATP-binding protein
MEPEVLRLEKIVKEYKLGNSRILALKGVSLTVARGEMVSIMGTSGCGKSTLLQVAGCIDRPTQGYVVIEGQVVQYLNDRELAALRNKKLGFVFQQFNLLPYERALENVEIPLRYSGLPKEERREMAARALEEVGLGDRIHHRPSELSGGQRQRVAIARAIVNDPALVFADEPTGALDRKSSEEVMTILQRLNRSGKSVVLVTHDRKVALYSQRLVELSDGKVVSEKDVKRPTASSLHFPFEEETGKRGGKICARCNSRNRPDSRFCFYCGFPLKVSDKSTASLMLRIRGERISCPRCNTLNPPLAKHCIACGVPLLQAYAPENYDVSGVG